MKALFIVVISLAIFSPYSMEIRSDCPRILSEENAGIDRLSTDLGMPNGAACLYSQLEETTIGPFVQAPDFCGCKDDFKSHSASLGSISNQSELIKNKIQEQVEISTMKAFKSRLYEVQDTAIAIDTMIRNQDLVELDAYRVKECTANKLWEVIEKLKEERNSDCKNLEKRVSYFTSSGDMKSLSSMDNMRDELVRLTNAVNENSKFAEDHNLPLRAFYSTQINQIPDGEDLDRVFEYVHGGFPPLLLNDETTLIAESQFAERINPYRTERSAESARGFYLESQEKLDAMRRSPVLRLLLQEEEGGKIEQELGQIAMKRDDQIDELFDNFLDQKEADGIELGYDTRKWPDEIRREFFDKQRAIEEEAKKRSHEILNDKEVIKKTLAIQDERCGLLFNEENIRAMFCEEIEPTDSVIREAVLPQVMGQLNPDADILALSVATNDLYCNPFRRPSEIFNTLDLENTFPSFLEEISMGTSQEFAKFDRGVAPILSKYMEDGVLSDEEKEQLIPELAAFLVDSGRLDAQGNPMVAEGGEGREQALATAEQLLRGNPSGELSSFVDRGLAQSLREIIDRPSNTGVEPVHEQGTIEGLFAESATGETGLASNYALTATDEDRERARAVASEVTAAEDEDRAINQQIVDANTFRPRDLRTGEIIPDARPIVMPTPSAGNVVAGRDVDVPPTTRSEPERRVASEKPIEEETTTRTSQDRSSSRTSNTVTPKPTRRAPTPTREIGPSLDDGPSREIADAEARLERRQRELDELVANRESGGGATDEELRTAMEELNNQVSRTRNLADRIRSGANNRFSPARTNSTYPSNYAANNVAPYNPFTTTGAENRFPSVIEDEERVATAISGTEELDKNKIGGKKGSSKSGKGVALDSGGGGGVAGGSVPGLPNGGLIKGFEGFKIGTCSAPTLFYIFPCFVKNDVFFEFNEIDTEFDEPKEISEKIQRPREMVTSLGLERKTWIKVKDLGINKETEKEEVLVTTYDWFPPMLEDVDRMNDEAWRNEKVSEVLANRWNWLFMRDTARETRILEQKLYNKEDFENMMEKRKMATLIKSTAGELYQNVNNLNVRITKENKSKIEKLKRELASGQR